MQRILNVFSSTDMFARVLLYSTSNITILRHYKLHLQHSVTSKPLFVFVLRIFSSASFFRYLSKQSDDETFPFSLPFNNTFYFRRLYTVEVVGKDEQNPKGEGEEDSSPELPLLGLIY